MSGQEAPLRVVLAALCLLLLTRAIAAQEPAPSAGDFGGAGLLEMRNARFQPDGTLEAGGSVRRQRRFYWVNFQALPWLEATFRLSERLNATTGRGTTTDRAFDLKARLIEEGPWTPALAIGLQDLIGTGIYGGEYVVASRRWHDFDFTLGAGFGRLGTARDFDNPLTTFGQRFAVRPRDVGRGGTLRLDFFRGRDVALFGGVEWSVPPVPTPWGDVEGLRAKLEFSGDRLRDERGGYPVRRGPLRGEAASRFNAGLQWSGEHVDAGIAVVNGTDLLVRMALRLDPANPPAAPPLRPAPAMPRRATEDAFGSNAPPASRAGEAPTLRAGNATPEERVHGATEADRAVAAFRALDAAGLRAVAYAETDAEARIAVAEGAFRTLPQVASRVLRAVNAILPPGIEMLRVSWWSADAEIGTIALPRRDLEAVAVSATSVEEAWSSTTLSAATGNLWLGAVTNPGPRFDWVLEPRLNLQLGDPSRTARYQAAGAAGARLSFDGGWALAGAVQQVALGNLDRGLPSDSLLPRVRSDYARYAREGKTSIPGLTAERIWNLAPDLFARGTAGLLEPMFGGVSAEVLWRPHDSPFAVGLDLNWVRQRAFEGLLGFRRYSVATGHVSLYADLPVWNLYAVVRAGRYLAGDWGGTLELGRRFDSGIEVGGFATLTNVPFRRFGEGSFDKGIYVRIPLDLFGGTTRGVGTALIRPVQRDGGQRLAVDNPLWELTRDGRTDAVRRGIGGYAR